MEYVRKAQTRLKLSWDLLSDAEVQECFSACLEKLGQYRRLTAAQGLRVSTIRQVETAARAVDDEQPTGQQAPRSSAISLLEVAPV